MIAMSYLCLWDGFYSRARHEDLGRLEMPSLLAAMLRNLWRLLFYDDMSTTLSTG
jgi:hypothetical protein